MKKLIAILCMAAVMIGSVFAAGSASADEAVVVDKDGKAIQGPWIELIPFDDNKADIEGYAIDALKVADDNVAVLTVDAILHDPDNVLTFPILIKFSVPEVKAGDKVIVAHMPDQDKVTEWESCEVIKVEDGFVTAKFNSLSPIVIFKYDAKQDDEGGKKAPQTGEAPVAAVAGMIAVVAFLGMAVTAKKEN